MSAVSIYSRSYCGVAGPLTFDMDSARWRRRLSNSLANDQIDLLAGYRTRGAPVEEPAGKKRTGVWQRRYWEHTLRDERDFNRHCDYIHFNPVKHGYVNSAKEWAFSSFHRFVERGVYPIDWGGGNSDDESDFGER